MPFKVNVNLIWIRLNIYIYTAGNKWSKLSVNKVPNARPIRQFVKLLFNFPNFPTITHVTNDNIDIISIVIEPYKYPIVKLPLKKQRNHKY